MSVLTERDDFRHALADASKRESLAFVLPIPDEQLGVILYTWVDGAAVAGSVAIVFGADGLLAMQQSGDVDAGDADFDDWRVGDLHVAQTRALETVTLTARGADVSFDLEATALHPAFAYGDHPLGTPRFQADERFEQSMAITGSLTVGDRTVAVDGGMGRDHSWGTRDWHYPQHWKWVHVIAADGLAMHLFELFVRGRREVRGYVARGGATTPIVDATLHAELTADATQKRLWGSVAGADGSSTDFATTIVCGWEFPVHDGVLLRESVAHAQLDGVAAVAHVEFLWPTAYLDHMRAHGEVD